MYDVSVIYRRAQKINENNAFKSILKTIQIRRS